MTQEITIEKMNEVIALFEGRKKTIVNDDEFLGANTWWSDPKQIDNFYCQDGDLKYHSSFDALIPVCKICHETMRNFPNEIVISGFDEYWKITEALKTFDIEKTHEAVYQFIEWFNQQSGREAGEYEHKSNY